VSAKRERSSLDELFDLLKLTPIWVGPLLVAIAFVAIRVVVPHLIPAKKGSFDIGVVLRPMIHLFAWFATAMILISWAAAEVSKRSSRRIFDRQTGIASIRSISWREFEHLVAEVYRRKGYTAEVVGNASGDGGVDIRLSRPGDRILVQCKQWRAYTVGVTTVRELLGVVVSQRATNGIVVTSGRFTKAARRFGQQNAQVELLDGQQLAELIRGIQTGGSGSSVSSPSLVKTLHTAPRCPACGVEMVSRTARKGPNAGSRFWGCPKYPACRETWPG
jgi:restriction system protein